MGYPFLSKDLIRVRHRRVSALEVDRSTFGLLCIRTTGRLLTGEAFFVLALVKNGKCFKQLVIPSKVMDHSMIYL